MEKITIETTEQLIHAMSRFEDNVLFRGQVKQYGTDDAPAMNTSFMRNGCIPPLMLRWAHYARFILAALLGRNAEDVDLTFTQAVLQHYGWRSFYLDASSNAAVSSWFAAHSFSSGRSIELCEDCFEDPVFLTKLKAEYTFEEGTGYLYVLSREALARRGLTSTDLSSIEMTDCRPRFHAQNAWLIGPLHSNLPVDCLLASITGPKAVFRDFAASGGYNSTKSIFPDIDEDPVLDLLMNLPWTEIVIPGDEKTDIPFFQQALELPEYFDSFRKHNPDYAAFYRAFNSVEGVTSTDVSFYSVPDDIIFGLADPIASSFPFLVELLHNEQKHVVFEIDNLVRKPGQMTSEYVKGIAVSKIGDNEFCVADFCVDHPGLIKTGCGINKGWSYKIDSEGRWVRFSDPDDCPCGNVSLHNHHLSSLTILEDHLQSAAGIVAKVEKMAVS